MFSDKKRTFHHFHKRKDGEANKPTAPHLEKSLVELNRSVLDTSYRQNDCVDSQHASQKPAKSQIEPDFGKAGPEDHKKG